MGGRRCNNSWGFRGQKSNGKVTITGISGTTIYIDSNGDGTGASPTFANNHAIGAYVAILTRNVSLKAYDPATNMHYGMSGSQNFRGLNFQT
jgi:hypothetical protein